MAKTPPHAAPEQKFNGFATMLAAQAPARGARLVSLTLCAFAVLAIAYAALAHMDIVISGQGRVVPSGKTMLVQAIEPGILRAVHARDGQKVKAGDPLLEIDGTTGATSGRLVSGASGGLAVSTAPTPALLDARLLEYLSKLAALDADVTRRRGERDAVLGAVAELEKSVALVGKKHSMREGLATTGHMPQSNLIDSNLELINLRKELYIQQNRLQETEATLNAAIQSRTQAEAEYKARYPAELVEVAKRQVSEHDSSRPGNKAARQVLRAPMDGIVRWLAPIAVGDPVSGSQNLLVVVPENAPLEIETLIFNKDIGHLKPGQRVIVKVETYDYTRYGHIEGAVQWVGVDTINDPKLGPVYAARVVLDSFETPNIVNGVRGKLVAGMTVTTDVRVAERRMIEYFLSPLMRYREESLRER